MVPSSTAVASAWQPPSIKNSLSGELLSNICSHTTFFQFHFKVCPLVRFNLSNLKKVPCPQETDHILKTSIRSARIRLSSMSICFKNVSYGNLLSPGIMRVKRLVPFPTAFYGAMHVVHGNFYMRKSSLCLSARL